MAQTPTRREETTPGRVAERRFGAVAMRCALFVGGMMAVAFLLVAVTLVLSTQRLGRERAAVLADSVAALTAQNAASDLHRRDRAALQTLAEGVARLPSVLSVEVQDGRGMRLASANNPRSSWLLLQAAAAGGGETRVLPVEQDGKRVGSIAVNVTPYWFIQALFGAYLPALAVAALALALSASATLAMVNRRARPLRRLIEFADAIRSSRRRPGDRLELRTGDEFETLGDAFNQITSRLDEYARRAHRLTFVDSVTNLPNHERFSRELARALTAAQGPTDLEPGGAVIVFSVDRLWSVSETLGQDVGRSVMVEIAKRLKATAPGLHREEGGETPAAPPVVARLSANEFGVLWRRRVTSEEAEATAEALAEPLNQPIQFGEHQLSLTCPSGVALFPEHGREGEAIMRRARLALNAARSAPQRPIKAFTPALDRAAAARLTLEREMRAALEANQFRAYFQPKVNLRTGRIVGSEALARWIKPDQTVISPARFIQPAEEMGLIGPISEVILRDACWKAAAWHREGLEAHIAVNVSALQFADDRFSAKVLRILDQSGLPNSCLQLEVTESVALEDPQRAIERIEPLRARGIRFAIDDFGTGHSSLAALTRMPFDLIKIDQSFVRGLNQDRHAPAIVETILAMAAALEYDVIAEGVETEAQAEYLRRRGCPAAQGFLYGAAIPPQEFVKLLRAGVLQPKPIMPPGAARLDPAA